jgi:hypothetical protein
MDSIPEPQQHIDSLREPARQAAMKQVAALCAARYLQGIDNEEELAKKARFPSVDAMRSRLRAWGLHGMLPQAKETRPKRRPKGTGQPWEELPSLDRAVEPLKEGVRRLQRALELLPYNRQWLKDKRIVTSAQYPKETGYLKHIYRRKEHHSLEWGEVCEAHGQDPGIEEFSVPVDTPPMPRGGSERANGFLLELVTNFVVTGGDPRSLLEYLHPNPHEFDEAALKKIEEDSQDLLLAAGHLATRLRGGEVKQGPSRPDIAQKEEQWAYWALRDQELYGWPDSRLPPSIRAMSSEERQRIKDLRLPPPKETL